MFDILNPEYAKPSSSELRVLLLTGIVSILIGVAVFEAYLVYLGKDRIRRPLGEGNKSRLYAMLWVFLLVGIPFCVAVIVKGPLGIAFFGILIGMGLVGIAHAILNRLLFFEDR